MDKLDNRHFALARAFVSRLPILVLAALLGCHAPPKGINQAALADTPTARLGPVQGADASASREISSPGDEGHWRARAENLVGLVGDGDVTRSGKAEGGSSHTGDGQRPDEPRRGLAGVWGRCRHDFSLSKEDHQHFYSLGNLGLMALGVGVAAPLANTSADREISRWYQDKVRTKNSDRVSTFVEWNTVGWVVVPLGLEAAALVGKAGEDYRSDGGLFEWGNRSVRTLAVGWPPLLGLQAVVGSDRPRLGSSDWRPFHTMHGASGHTFMGAVPFLTAAAMTDDPFWKCPLFLGSFLAAWSRINEDRHYFSQVVLGWWVAYLAVKSVDQTQGVQRSFSILPLYAPDGAGVAVQVRY